MKITFYYVCPSCQCQWSQTLQNPGALGFLDSSCNCPSCQEECYAEETKLS